METDMSIVYVIIVGCTVFGVVTAYLIYNHVQQERADYYKDKLRRKTANKDPINYDYVTRKEKEKEALAGGVAVAETPGTDGNRADSTGGVPVPAPLLAPVVLPPLPGPTPPPVTGKDTSPVVNAEDNHQPSTNNGDATFPASGAAMMAGAVGVGGAFAAYEMSSMKAPAHEESSPKKTKKKKQTKERNDKENGDFDDYRNFSPTVLPPPKGVPPPQANYSGSTQARPEVDATTNADTEPLVSERHDVPRRPKVALVSREGLLF